MPPAAELVARFVPDVTTLLFVAPAALACGAGAGAIAAALRRRGVRVAFTRKIFHVVIFSAAGATHLLAGVTGVLVYGTVVAALVLVSVPRGDGDPLYEALARPSDAPRRGLFVVVPLLATALGDSSRTCWRRVSPTAAISSADGGTPPANRPEPDSAGAATACTRSEACAPGARWKGARRSGSPGRRPPCSPSLPGMRRFAAFAVGLACGTAGAAVEAVSTRGLDNLTVQLAAVGTAAALLG